MQTLFSTLLVLGMISGILWWNFYQPTQTQQTNTVQTAESNTNNSTQTQNKITEPIQKAENVKNLIESNNLYTLDLSNNNLTQVTNKTFSKVDLQVLNLSHNKLTGSLPGEIRHLENLISLDLSNNNFTGVPAEIGQLKKLEVLNLSNNQLTGLPHELGNLSQLKVLNVSGNAYSESDLTIIRTKLEKDVTIITK